MTSLWRVLADPDPDSLGEDVEAFLRELGGPTCIALRGERSGSPRALVTLLHGNEPSGSHAVHAFLRAREKPAVDLLVFIANVEAALLPPLFSHRHAPGRPDLNRCFRAPFEGVDGALCEQLVQRLREARCEVLVDVHNTSGRGPAYAVCTRIGDAQRALASLFVSRIVHTGQRLGTLMEATEDLFPTVTVECGGARDSASHAVALAGLRRLAHSPQIAGEHPALSVRAHPIRVELAADAQLAFSPEPVAGADITLAPDLDRHNFEPLRAGQRLGFVGLRGLDVLHAKLDGRAHALDAIFEARDGELVAADDLELLMVTTDAQIAREDCLFYVVKA